MEELVWLSWNLTVFDVHEVKEGIGFQDCVLTINMVVGAVLNFGIPSLQTFSGQKVKTNSLQTWRVLRRESLESHCFQILFFIFYIIWYINIGRLRQIPITVGNVKHSIQIVYSLTDVSTLSLCINWKCCTSFFEILQKQTPWNAQTETSYSVQWHCALHIILPSSNNWSRRDHWPHLSFFFMLCHCI